MASRFTDRMGTLTGPDKLASLLTARGLATEPDDRGVLYVSNPISGRLHEIVHHQSEQYVTDWGYSLGVVGDEQGTAGRIAFLLGVPSE